MSYCICILADRTARGIGIIMSSVRPSVTLCIVADRIDKEG